MRLIAAPDGTVTRIDRALWLTIPFDRVWYIIVVPDCRTYDVPAEDRTFAVPAEDRTFAMVAEDRTYEVPAEDRTFAVPAEDRTFEVMCG